MPKPTATVEVHHYHSTRRVFYIVRCDDCQSVLNSGHHYRSLDDAAAFAARHDAERH